MTYLRNVGLALSLLGLLLIAIGAPPLFAQQPESDMGDRAMTHEQMHEMMDAMHGEGTSQRMHEAMGPDGERMMEQCAAMMNMMMRMPGMMGAGEGQMPEMPGDGMPPRRDMMDRMMGR